MKSDNIKLSSLDLKFAIDCGIINPDDIMSRINDMKKEEFLKKHTYKIWEGENKYWYTYLPDKTSSRGTRLVKKRTRDDLDKAIIDYWQSYASTVEYIFYDWHDKRLELGKIAPSSYSKMCNTFNRHFKTIGRKSICDISPEDWAEFMEEQIPKENLSRKGFSDLKTIVRGVVKKARRQHLIEYTVEDVFAELDVSDIDFKKNHRRDSEEVFTPEEVNILFDYLADNLDTKNLGIMLMFATGLRIGEVVALKPPDVEPGIVHVRRSERSYKLPNKKGIIYEISDPKTEAGYRDVVIPSCYDWLIKKIRSLNPFGEFIFMENGKRITTRSLRSRFDRIIKKLGIIHKSPHKARKTYISILLDNVTDTRFVRDQVGHASIETSEAVYHKNRKTVDKKREILDKIEDFAV